MPKPLIFPVTHPRQLLQLPITQARYMPVYIPDIYQWNGCPVRIPGVISWKETASHGMVNVMLCGKHIFWMLDLAHRPGLVTCWFSLYPTLPNPTLPLAGWLPPFPFSCSLTSSFSFLSLWLYLAPFNLPSPFLYSLSWVLTILSFNCWIAEELSLVRALVALSNYVTGKCFQDYSRWDSVTRGSWVAVGIGAIQQIDSKLTKP